MTDRPFAAAIAATIPSGDPHSQARMEWCKDAADAIAQVCLDHAEGEIDFACDGIRASFEHAMKAMYKKAMGR